MVALLAVTPVNEKPPGVTQAPVGVGDTLAAVEGQNTKLKKRPRLLPSKLQRPLQGPSTR